MIEVVVVGTGVANTASVLAAFARRGVVARLCDNAIQVARASAVVLPGVGSFGAGMDALRSRGLDEVIRNRVLGGAPTLAICLGMQLLFEESEESPGVPGLGVATGVVRRFTGVPRVPQMGWNTLTAARGCRTLASGSVYYANSFRVAQTPVGWRDAWTQYGGAFLGGMEREDAPAVVACQFHPELSGAAGAALLSRWLVAAEECVPCS